MTAISVCDLFRRCVQAQAGEDWCQFIQVYGCRVHGLVGRLLRNSRYPFVHQDHEDLVQDLYYRLLGISSSASFRGSSEGELLGFLTAIISNMIRDRLRSLRTAKRGGKESLRQRRHQQDFEGVAGAVCTRPTPEERLLVQDECRQFLKTCYRHTRNTAARKLVRLAFVEGYSSTEIAATLGGSWSADRVDQTICRLRRCLARDGICLPRRSNLHGKGRIHSSLRQKRRSRYRRQFWAGKQANPRYRRGKLAIC